MLMPLDTNLERPGKMTRTELMVAVIALLMLLAARPLMAQTNQSGSQSLGQSGSPTTPAPSQNSTVPPATTGNSGTLLPGSTVGPNGVTTNPAPHTTANQPLVVTPGPNGNSNSQSTYLNAPNRNQPAQTINPGSSQSQREANARQGGAGLNGTQNQALPECRIEDTACIEQRNRLNQTNPQTAPTFNR